MGGSHLSSCIPCLSRTGPSHSVRSMISYAVTTNRTMVISECKTAPHCGFAPTTISPLHRLNNRLIRGTQTAVANDGAVQCRPQLGGMLYYCSTTITAQRRNRSTGFRNSEQHGRRGLASHNPCTGKTPERPYRLHRPSDALI